MYPHFIEVHDIEDEQDVMSINIDNICNFHVDKDGMTVIRTIGNIYYFISESYDEVKKLITDSGCLIQMGDPRLDTKHPLTKEDIKNMGVGEPVWHSNKMMWYIISEWSDLESFYVCLMSHKNYIDMNEEDLIKTPLYRMKVTDESA